MLAQEAIAQPARTRGSEPLAGAYLGVLAFFVVYCARPEDWIPGLHVVPLAKITAMFALAALALSLRQARRLPREVFYLFLLFAQLCLTVPFSSVWRGGAFAAVLEFSKVVVLVPVVVLAVTTLARLRRLIFVQTASVLAVALVSLVKGHSYRGRLEGVLGGVYENSNDLALAIVLTIPFCFAFMLSARGGFRKGLWLLSALVMTYATFLTGSRGGFLSLVVAAGILLWEFVVKGGRRHLLLGAGVLVLGGFLVAGAGLKGRLHATFGTSAQDKDAYSSALARRELLWRSVVVTVQHPLFGIGPNNFQIVSGAWHVAHNSFTELSAEGGLPALILFILLFWTAFHNVQKAQLLARGQTQEMLLAGALRASLAGFIVGALFASVEYHFFPYFLVAYTTALCAIAGKQASQEGSRQWIAAPSERESEREPRGSTVTWADYQRGRAI